MSKVIPVQVKKTCCEMYEQGKTPREIYNEYYKASVEDPAKLDSFRQLLHRWNKHKYADLDTLEAGTYEGFIAHDATVQVSKSGEIIQAWIKQKANGIDTDEFIAAVRANTEPYDYIPPAIEASDRMLEIDLFDMHWGVAFMDHYEPVLKELLELIHSRTWDKIVIPFGQDFFHNDSIVNGQTTKGTQIEKVDMMRAVKEGKRFMYTLIENASRKAKQVEVIYTAGNHDRSISWMFMQMLHERFDRCDSITIDDSLEFRKVISYGTNAVMITHGDSKQATAKNLAHIFPISFPKEFAEATVREVHAGHLHHEAEADIYGVMVRRLSTGGKVDGWSDKEDFVGAHRRFMVFEWDRNKLASIHYI